MTELLVTIREVYGRRLIYPACDKARILCEIKGTKTLEWTDLERIKALGFTVKEVHHNQLGDKAWVTSEL